ncbi:hypothetical protein [Hazenella coriacea]|uniref:Uncharacterized protein n=1 Tax=Hazenella coriacea TaxID=1179467 RepID=A0A4R3LCH6_9BACL|nr:hypothetical protein [Hazenella coriacea]TCS97008.1 hypothetical protein EDD58_101655 [Hazenella coriacea]
MLSILDILYIIFMSSSGAVIGAISIIVQRSFQKKVLNDLGLDQLPKDPQECNQMLIKRCSYLRSWTNLDTLHVGVLLYGLLLLLCGLIVSFIEMITSEIVRVDVVPVNYGLLLTSFILILISSILILQRFWFVIRLHQSDQDQPIQIPNWMIRKSISWNKKSTTKNSMPITTITLSILGPLVGVSSFFIMKQWGLPSFLVVMGIFVVISILLPIFEYQYRKKKNTKSIN